MEKELIAPELPVQRNPRNSDLLKGWHEVAKSENIEVGKSVSIEDFATQLVIWRGNDKRLRALDLYCRHMGCSLATGEVDENGIRCPFHAWRWDEAGNCDDIPYAKSIPTKAVTRAWKIKEDNGSVMVWFDPSDI